jgi:hypothetical protein
VCTRNFCLVHCSFGSGWSSQEGVFDENAAFEDRFSPKKCNRLPAEFVELEGPSVVYNFMEESAWAVWKRLAAEVIFVSPNRIDIPSSGYHRLPLELVSTMRYRLFWTENALVMFPFPYLQVYVT